MSLTIARTLAISLAIIFGACSFTTVFGEIVTNRGANPNDSTVPGTAWTSQTAADVITIQNGTGVNLAIQINVDANASRTGINVNNCGTTTHINSGSVGICVTADARNPVSFVTDNGNQPVSGTYIVQVMR